MLFSLGGGGGPRQLVLPGPKAVCSTSTCCRIAGCTCLGISSGLPDNSSDPSGPRSIRSATSSPYCSTYFFLALQLLHLLSLVLNIQACLPKHRQEPPGHQTSCLPVSGGDFQLHYLQGFSDILTWRPGIAKYAATACHRMPQRGGRPHTHRPPHRPRGHCPECEEFSARPVCQRRADCGEKILAVRRPIAEGAKDETASFHRGEDTGSLT